MPESDGFMRAMIQGALASRADRGPEIFVVNSFETSGAEPGECNEQRQRYTRLFPTLDKEPERIVPKTFAEAWQEGLIRSIFESK
jgi:hypothetical protein